MESSNKKTTSVNTKNTEIKKGFIPAQLFDIDIWHFSNSLNQLTCLMYKYSSKRTIALLSKLKGIVEKFKEFQIEELLFK